jgi:chemotaxis protein methyltransferase CheR
MRTASSRASGEGDAVPGATMRDEEFDFIRHVVSENAGIVLGPNKRQLVQGRIARRMREIGLQSYEAYCQHVRDSGPEELVGLINALTTNVTSFFRENHHFDALAEYMIPEALKRNAATRRLRIWSAGCSTGEEPYCIAMVASEVMPTVPRWDFRILATDIDSDVIAQAQAGIYPLERVSSVPEQRLRRWFNRGVGSAVGQVRVRSGIADFITFRTLNLMHEWPMRGPFDVVFCRNVMIYFDQPTRERLIDRFAQILAPGGYLCIGHSESIHNSSVFKLVGKTIYRRVGA